MIEMVWIFFGDRTWQWFFEGKIIFYSIFKDFSDEEKYQNEFLKLLDKCNKEKQQKNGRKLTAKGQNLSV